MNRAQLILAIRQADVALDQFDKSPDGDWKKGMAAALACIPVMRSLLAEAKTANLTLEAHEVVSNSMRCSA